MSYRFFQNRDCEYFPCKETDRLNCLFCFCPLYTMDCGGDFIILENGWKDCSKCFLPHRKNGYAFVIDKIRKYHAEKD